MSLEERILDIKSKLERDEYPNEQSISQGILLRLLGAMGWDIFDPQSVIPEYPVKRKRVDYALCATSNKPFIFIEVKQPGKAFGADQQLFEYAFHKGVPFAVLTDGKEWHFYLPAAPGDYEERKVYKLDLIERDVNESADRLRRYLSFDAVVNGKAIGNAQQDHKDLQIQKQAETSIPEAWQKLIEEKDDLLVELVSEKAASICGSTPGSQKVISYLKSLKISVDSLAVRPPAISTELQQKEQSHEGSSRGRAIKEKIKVTFPDGEEIYDNEVKNTFVETIRMIGAEKVHSLKMCFPRGHHLVSQQKDKMRSSGDVGDGLHVNTNSATKIKFEQLQEINNRLNSGLKIELVQPDQV